MRNSFYTEQKRYKDFIINHINHIYPYQKVGREINENIEKTSMKHLSFFLFHKSHTSLMACKWRRLVGVCRKGYGKNFCCT